MFLDLTEQANNYIITALLTQQHDLSACATEEHPWGLA